ncbi:PREDICTED: gamma-tubulin complex component 6 isoform X2 [Tarenaya hassleriana]|uniref:gamma-tubulin complex component 6 isoform X2 n=1 Tax=Tarenaya hassleriana TaxID=28532 RepID=UPI00053C9370|nr:PREDICTED: gamma-tubulin complex component 6 isoform X2 [Tarenaya hassleriana]
MAEETSLASLMERLKVEEPWLPPRTWESIPSESGRFPPPPHPSASPSSSSVSESSLVRLALNALQGVESALISIEKLSSAFCSEPADRTFHKIPSLWHRSSSTNALGHILTTIGCFGSSVFLLHKFVDHFTSMKLGVETVVCGQEKDKVEENQDFPAGKANSLSCSSYTLVNQAFAIAVRKVLEGYISGLNTLCASVEFRCSSNILDASIHNSSGLGCLTNVVQSKMTLLEVFLHTRELRTQIEALANICDVYDVSLSYCDAPWENLTAEASSRFHKFFMGGDLLSYLYSQLKVADPAHSAMLKFLFLKTCEPYCGFIRSWIFEAQVSDPHKEFIVECTDELQPFWWSEPGISPLITERGVVVPCFLEGFLVPLVRAGQQLQVITKLLELCNFSASREDNYADLLPHWTCYSITSPPHASPITFSKMHIEATVQARDNYYRRMQDKLGYLTKTLELFSEQVAGAGSLPIFYRDGQENLNSLGSITLDESLLIPSVAERDSTMDQYDLDSDDQSTEDRSFPETDTTWSSECSSTGDSEEATETELHVSHSTLSKQNHLSAVRFSIASADSSCKEVVHQLDKPCNIDNNFTSQCIKTALHGQCMDPKSEASTGLCMDTKYRGPLPIKSWPLGVLPKNPFYIDKEYTDSDREHPSDSGAHMGEEKRVINTGKSMPLFNISAGGKSKEQERWQGWAGNSSSPKLSLFNDPKINCLSNVLSINPVLVKCDLFSPVSKHGEAHRGHQGKSLPCFDFSVVDDPSKACLTKLSVGPRVGFHQESNISLNSSRNHNHANKKCDTDRINVEDPKVSYSHLPSGFKGGAEEDKANAFGGSRWESLLGLSKYPEASAISDCRQNSFGTFELPLDFVIDKCLLQEIILQYNFVSKFAIKLLEGFGLQEHLLALRRYHFMELADWADQFLISLWHHKWLVTEADKRIAEIQGFLELSIQRSSCEQDPCKDRLFLYMKKQDTMHLASSVVGVRSFDFLGLGYRMDWPVSIVLTCDALKAYADVFSFLVQVKLAAYALTDIWCSVKDMRHRLHQNQQEITNKELWWLNILMKLRHQVNHFVSTLQQYVQSELSHVSWSKFLHSLRHKVKDMMDLELVHMTYLNEALHICFLSDETTAISSIIENILQCALDFRSCLPRGIPHTGQEQSNPRSNTLGINTSQVTTLKQNFDKHLKELHSCYLRSPKHRNVGLSRFWGYLNFNQYYSEVFTGANTFTFIC